MSRGPGRWQRALLEAVASTDDRVHVLSWLRESLGREPTPAERSAAHRAARQLVKAGKIQSNPAVVSMIWSVD